MAGTIHLTTARRRYGLSRGAESALSLTTTALAPSSNAGSQRLILQPDVRLMAAIFV